MQPTNLSNIISGPWEEEISYELSSSETAYSPGDKSSSAISYQLAEATPNNKKIGKQQANNKIFNDEFLNKIKTMSKTDLRKEYKSEASSHSNMKQRCKNGKYVCHADFKGFSSFLELIGPKPDPSYSLDRIDPANPEYSQENCRWASKQLQSLNKQNIKILTDLSGNSKPLTEWANITGTNSSTMHSRLAKGWPEHEIIYGRSKQQIQHEKVKNKGYGPDNITWGQIFPESYKLEVIDKKYTEQRRKNSDGRYELPYEWVIREYLPGYLQQCRYCTDHWGEPELIKKHDDYVKLMKLPLKKSLYLFYKKHSDIKTIPANQLAAAMGNIFKY